MSVTQLRLQIRALALIGTSLFCWVSFFWACAPESQNVFVPSLVLCQTSTSIDRVDFVDLNLHLLVLWIFWLDFSMNWSLLSDDSGHLVARYWSLERTNSKPCGSMSSDWHSLISVWFGPSFVMWHQDWLWSMVTLRFTRGNSAKVTPLASSVWLPGYLNC